MPAALVGAVELVVELVALVLFVRQQEFVVAALVVSEHALEHSEIDLYRTDHVSAHDDARATSTPSTPRSGFGTTGRSMSPGG